MQPRGKGGGEGGGEDPSAKGNSAVASKVAGSRARGMKHRVAFVGSREIFFFFLLLHRCTHAVFRSIGCILVSYATISENQSTVYIYIYNSELKITSNYESF